MLKKIIVMLILCSGVVFSQQLVNEKEIGPGVTYKIFIDEDKPLYICVTEVNLTNPDILVDVAPAYDAIGYGGERVQDFVKRKSENNELIIAAVNADFFGGKPHQAQNSMVASGEVIKGMSRYGRSLFGITKDKKPFSGVIKYQGYIFAGGDTLRLNSFNYNEEPGTGLFNEQAKSLTKIDSGFIGYAFTGSEEGTLRFIEQLGSGDEVNFDRYHYILKLPEGQKYIFDEGEELNIVHKFDNGIDDIYAMTGGLPYLIRDGKRPDTYIGVEGLTSMGFVGVNPRTAVGFNKAGDRLYIVAVDGRNPKISAGIPLTDLADFMIGLGCYEAVNLDGGGSTAMTVRDKVVNHPSDITGVRPVHNFLYVKTKSGSADYIEDFRFEQDTISVSTGEYFEIKERFFDKWGFPLMNGGEEVSISLPEGITENEGKYSFTTAGEYNITGEAYSGKDTIIVIVKEN